MRRLLDHVRGLDIDGFVYPLVAFAAFTRPGVPR
jgi:hypothetical protein